MSLDPHQIADGWRSSTDRVLRFSDPKSRVDRLLRVLVFNSAVSALDWAHPTMREAAAIRVQQIIDEIGTPRQAWLSKKVAAEVKLRNEVHAFVQGKGPCPLDASWVSS